MSKKSERANEILAVYSKHGGWISVRRLNELCWEEGIFDAEERRNMAFRATMRICAQALKTIDASGLPRAIPTDEVDDEGSKVWKQPLLIEYAEAQEYLGLLIRQQYADQRKVKDWVGYMMDRWETVPPYPTLAYPEHEPMWWIKPDPEDDDEFDSGYTKDPDEDDC